MFSYLLQCKDQYFETKRVLWGRSQKKYFTSSDHEPPHLPPKCHSNKNFNFSRTLSVPKYHEALTVHKGFAQSRVADKPDIENKVVPAHENEKLVKVSMLIDRNLSIFDYKVLYAIGKKIN